MSQASHAIESSASRRQWADSATFALVHQGGAPGSRRSEILRVAANERSEVALAELLSQRAQRGIRSVMVEAARGSSPA